MRSRVLLLAILFTLPAFSADALKTPQGPVKKFDSFSTLRQSFESLEKLPKDTKDREFLWKDAGSGKTISHFVLNSQFPESRIQLGGSCYAHAAAELIAAAYSRLYPNRTKKNPVIIDGDLLALWFHILHVGDENFTNRIMKADSSSDKFIFDGGYVNEVLDAFTRVNRAYLYTAQSQELVNSLNKRIDFGAKELREHSKFSVDELTLTMVRQILAEELSSGTDTKKVEPIPTIQFPKAMVPQVVELWDDQELHDTLTHDMNFSEGSFGEKTAKIWELWPNLGHHVNPKMHQRVLTLMHYLRNYIPVSVGIYTASVETTTDAGKTWQTTQYTGFNKHAVVLQGFAIWNSKLYWIFHDHFAQDGMSFLRFPFEESYRIYLAHAFVLPGEI